MAEIVKEFPGKKLLRITSIGIARRRLRCVFVLSTGRVGTDSLTRLLALSPNIRAHHEPVPKFLAETKLAYHDDNSRASVGGMLLNSRLFYDSENTQIRECLLKCLVYVETSNRLTYIAHELAKYFPNSKFIHLHRNPADVVRSAMRRGYYDDHIYDQFRIEPRYDDPFVEHWTQWTTFEKCCWYWQAVNGLCINIMAEIAPARSFDLPSDILFSADTEKLNAIFDWIGIKPPSSEAMKNVLRTKHNAQEQRQFPKWPQWNDENRERMAAIVHPIAIKLGYQQFITPAQSSR